jgi:hypothetical protein
LRVSKEISKTFLEIPAPVARRAIPRKWHFAMALWIITAFSQVSALGAATIKVGISCEVEGKVEDDLDAQACSEMIGLLEKAYPKVIFLSNPPQGLPSIAIVIRTATRSGLGLKLKWRTASGKVSEGQLLSVFMMDRDIDSGRRNSLYHRALAETPMPKLIGQE